jgi:hypothetical protein
MKKKVVVTKKAVKSKKVVKTMKGGLTKIGERYFFNPVELYKIDLVYKKTKNFVTKEQIKQYIIDKKYNLTPTLIHGLSELESSNIQEGGMKKIEEIYSDIKNKYSSVKNKYSSVKNKYEGKTDEILHGKSRNDKYEKELLESINSRGKQIDKNDVLTKEVLHEIFKLQERNRNSGIKKTPEETIKIVREIRKYDKSKK